ncbi:P-loop containing nucleoside triphosphate hydrolase protein [Mycena capillaripes]|nr:P-loop containing nucleoside triphosphate hydrolase protein [Mycena capillaripes]
MKVASDSISQTYMNPFETAIVLLGELGAGKTALAIRFTEDRWDDSYDVRNSDMVWRSFRILDNRACFVEAVVFQEDHFVLWAAGNQHVEDRLAFLLVYSVTSRATFERLEEFRQRVLKLSTASPMMVVGTKCDCTEAEREVSEAEGAEFAANIGCPFVETSAKTSHNVEFAFVDLVRELLKRAPPVVPMSSRKQGRSRKRCVIM